LSFNFLVLCRFEFELLRVQLEVKGPAEGCLLVQAPDGLRAIGDGVPALFVEPLGLLETAEQQRERELTGEAILWLMDEVDHLQVFVKTPCPEV
jgi:hypothetical protein